MGAEEIVPEKPVKEQIREQKRKVDHSKRNLEREKRKLERERRVRLRLTIDDAKETLLQMLTFATYPT